MRARDGYASLHSRFAASGRAVRSHVAGLVGPAVLCAVLGASASAQTISGTVFEDRDRDGVHDAGEPAVQGISVELYGTSDANGAQDVADPTDAAGAFSFSPGDGCYLLRPLLPPDWRYSQPYSTGVAEGTPGYSAPVGEPRFGALPGAIDRLRAGSLDYASMGDSIAWNWNSCFYQSTFWYSRQVRSRMECAAPAATLTLDEAAIKGEHTDDLLVDDFDDTNNVFRQIASQPDFITISMIGNDLLDVDAGNNPTQQETNIAVEEVLDARANLQEAISAMLSEIPQADITLNTLYDNEAYDCGGTLTSDFHRDWIPIITRMLRDLAWGQARPVGVNAVAEEFAREYLDGSCTGFENKICRDIFSTDLIHPNNAGYQIVREKVWEAAGGVLLGSRDAADRSSQTEADFGLVRRVRRLLPTATATLNGATTTTPEAALDDDDGGATAAIRLGIGSEEFRLSGFPDWYDEIRLAGVIAGVRYSVTGDVTDDFYRIEASPTSTFRPPPGYNYAPDNWNFYTPIVGGGGPNAPALNPDYGSAKLLVVPEPASPRTVSATLTKNPELPPGGADYTWPAFTPAELGSVELRVAAAPVAGTAGNDVYDVQLDAGWLDLYGWELPRPAEVAQLRVDRAGDGTLTVSFDAAPAAIRYNLYTGRLASLPAYDHGSGAPRAPDCDANDVDAGGGRRSVDVPATAVPAESAYFLITAHDADDVESPSGTATGGTEIDRSQSVCF